MMVMLMVRRIMTIRIADDQKADDHKDEVHDDGEHVEYDDDESDTNVADSWFPPRLSSEEHSRAFKHLWPKLVIFPRHGQQQLRTEKHGRRMRVSW